MIRRQTADRTCRRAARDEISTICEMTIDNTLCLIPAKGGSTRLARKNLLPLGGRPLIAHAIEKARSAGCFAAICVSTEDSEIAAVARRYGAETPFVRPDTLARDPATIVDVMLHALEQYRGLGTEFEQICVLLPTTPFVTLDDIRAAMALFADCKKSVLLGVTQTEFPPFNAWLVNAGGDHPVLEPCFPDSPYKYTKSTECPQTYRSNGAVLIVSTKGFVQNRGYRGMEIVPYIMPTLRSIDIDTRDEYLYAQYLYEKGEHAS